MAEAVLVATGRDPAVQGLGLEAAGVEVGPQGVVLDGELRTVRYGQVPWTYPTDPERAQVGLREDQASARGGPVVVSRADCADLYRAITLGEARGLVKVVADGPEGRLLGVHIVGARALHPPAPSAQSWAEGETPLPPSRWEWAQVRELLDP